MRLFYIKKTKILTISDLIYTIKTLFFEHY